MPDLVWLGDEHLAQLEPPPPTDTRGMPRTDDRARSPASFRRCAPAGHGLRTARMQSTGAARLKRCAGLQSPSNHGRDAAGISGTRTACALHLRCLSPTGLRA